MSDFVVIAGVLHGTTFWGADQLYAEGEGYGMSQAFAARMSPYCAACFEFFPGSSFIRAIDDPRAPGGAPSCGRDGAAVDGVGYTSLATEDDGLVRPPTSGFIAAACRDTTDVLLQDQCPTDHADRVAVADPVVATDVLNAIDPAHRRPVPCPVVVPGLGTVGPPPS